MFKKNIFLQIIHSAATQENFCCCCCKERDSSRQFCMPRGPARAEFSEAMRKTTGEDTPNFQRAWEPENTGRYATTPRKARLSCLCRLGKT